MDGFDKMRKLVKEIRKNKVDMVIKDANLEVIIDGYIRKVKSMFLDLKKTYKKVHKTVLI